MPSKEFKFTIGADPEFNIEMNNKKLNAAATIRALLNNNTKFEKTEDGFSLKEKKIGDIGWDGHNATGEIRPAPSKKPKEVIENLREMFTEFNKTAPLFELSTLSRSGPIGGHIHFEIERTGESDRVANISDRRMKALHKRLTSFYLPIMMGENKINLMVRLKSDYGRVCGGSRPFVVDNKFNYPNGESGYTYELRYPSAEWMTTPKIANATLAYLGVVYNEITHNPKKFEKICKDIILRTDEQGNALQTLTMAEYKPLTMSIFGKIQKYIKTFELYEEFKEEINYIMNPKKVLADKQAANYDIRIGWGLKETTKEATKKRIISDKAFKIEAKKKDLDTMSQFVKICHNEDMNVESFAKAITKRSIAFNWDLKKTYYFFGIRKGIKDYIIVNTEGKIIKGLKQCKTTSDVSALQSITNKIQTKALNAIGGNYETQKLNFSTGKLDKIKNEIVLIGIPYEERLENPKKNFIELVYNIEKNKIKETNNKEAKINDTNKPEEEKGEIWKIINGIEINNIEIAEQTRTEPRNSEHVNEVIRDMVEEEQEQNEITSSDTSTEETTDTTLSEREIEQHIENNTITTDSLIRATERMVRITRTQRERQIVDFGTINEQIFESTRRESDSASL